MQYINYPHIKLLACLYVLLVIVSGCATSPDEITAKHWFDRGIAAIDNENYLTAEIQLDGLLTHFPFSQYSEQGMLEALAVSLQLNKLTKTRAIGYRFERSFADSDQIDYVLYTRALSWMDSQSQFAVKYLKVPAYTRDQGYLTQAFRALSKLTNLYPYSKYATDSRQRMIYIRNQQALAELEIGKHYLQNNILLAAINRGQHIIERYPSTPVVPQALALMAAGYRQLGLLDLADKTQLRLEKDFPNYLAQQPVAINQNADLK